MKADLNDGRPDVAAQIAIIGGGPAGLMAAERLSAAGHQVTVYDAMPTVGRKFLLAGKTGLNITHSEAYDLFAGRFGSASGQLRPALDRLLPHDIRVWAKDLGTETFVGSSGRVFPEVMKASPLLRAWLRRLDEQGVTFRLRHRWVGFAETGALRFETPEGETLVQADATLLALGGASWPKLGSDAAWTGILEAEGVALAPLLPANCGFDCDWSLHFRERFAGAPVKSVMAHSDTGSSQGEFVISQHGIEGSLVYAHAAALRDRLTETGSAVLTLDLAPGRDLARMIRDLGRQDGKASFSTRLRKATGLDAVKVALLREVVPESVRYAPEALAGIIKALPLRVVRPRPIAEAISTAGGIRWDEIDDSFMVKARPGLFVAGEMIDWEAPTGGYLLTACMATGRAAADGILDWLNRSG
jgi:uncharacterized flavoprotein (TIGR03862 family)